MIEESYYNFWCLTIAAILKFRLFDFLKDFKAAIIRLPSLRGPKTATSYPSLGGDAMTACKAAANG